MSAGPRWGDVHAAILAKLPTLSALSGWSVFDGYPVTSAAPLNSVTVGFVTDDGAGTFAQSWDTSGYAVTEVGTLLSMIRCNTGGSDPATTRDRAFAAFAEWQQWLASDHTLGGVLSPQTEITLSADVHMVQDQQGSATGLLVTTTYQTTTFVA